MEFACAIPGTAGGGVRMNAGAYGRRWSGSSGERLSSTPQARMEGERRAGARPPGARQFGRGQIVAEVEFELDVPTRRVGAPVSSELNTARKATQPTNKRTFGSVFKNPSTSSAREDARRVRAARVQDRRGPDLAETRELHRECRRGVRYARRLALMAESGRACARARGRARAPRSTSRRNSRSRSRRRRPGVTAQDP